MTTQMHTPAIGQTVRYVTTSQNDNPRDAVVVGYPDTPISREDLHLAVLRPDGVSLDLLAFAVPNSTHPRAGYWTCPAVEIEPTGDVEPAEAPEPDADEEEQQDTGVMDTVG